MELNAYPEANLGYLSTVGSHLGDRPVMAEAVRVAIAEIERLRASLLAASDDQSAKAMELRELNKMAERDGDAIMRLQAERDKLRAYEKEWLAASDACSWMHDDKTLDIQLGRRLTVEGVAALRKQRDGLRASQFRWIPFSEKLPEVSRFLINHRGEAVVWKGRINPPELGVTHWFPIPSLPEKSQADRDEELWEKAKPGLDCFGGEARAGFLAGLKAAREQKP